MERKSERAYQTEKSVFASRLTEIMEARGLNQTHLQAQILEQSGKTLQRQTISLYMNGQSKPDTERLTLLCEALDVSSDYLLGLSDVISPDFDLKAVCEYTNLSEAAVMRVRDMESLNDILCTLGEDYETAEGGGDIVDALSHMLESDEGIEFLNMMCLVARAAESASVCLAHIREEAAEMRYDRLRTSLRDIKLHLYELSESSRKLAQSLYCTDDLEKELTRASRNVWNENWEEAQHGEHTED